MSKKNGGGYKRNKKKKFHKKNLQCYNCKMFGRFADECQTYKDSKDDNNEVQFASANDSN